MKTTASNLFALALLVSSLSAQDTTTAAKIDTVLLNQKAMMEMQQKIYTEVQYVPPLANKWAGIELNLARLLVSSGQDYLTVSGTVSFFAITRSGEIAFPFFYQSGSRTKTETFSSTKYEVPLTLLNLDATYRHFLGGHQDGFYFSAGTRYTYIKGIEGADFIIFSFNQGGPEVSTSKVGAYFGAGYRYFTQSGFYWGVSVIYGRYFGGERDYQEVLLDDGKTIIDIELLKFGFAF